ASGEIGTHARLVGTHPPGLAPLLHARGFGPAGVHALHEALGATDLDEVERAAREGRLAEALGARRADDLLAQLPALRNPVRAVRLKSAWETARLMVDLLQDPQVGPRQIEVAGSARRMCDLIIDGLELVAIPGPAGGAALHDLLARLPSVVQVLERTARLTRVRLYDGVEVRLHLAPPAAWGAALLWHTGSAAHLVQLAKLAEKHGWRLGVDGLVADGHTVGSATEEEMYRAL